jgi:hypothetical protein
MGRNSCTFKGNGEVRQEERRRPKLNPDDPNAGQSKTCTIETGRP